MKNELTGQMTYQRVQAHYNNPYDFTVYVEVIDEQGKHQTIVSNKIHPFFTQVNQGELVPSSEGHHYNGEIQNAQWVDAQNLKAGYKLLSENNHWQTVKGVTIKAEKLSAYNLTVETDHTYFIKGANSDLDGVWVHNNCWNSLPADAVNTGKTTPDGRALYTFKDNTGKQVTAYKGKDERYYNPKVYPPEKVDAVNAKAIDNNAMLGANGTKIFSSTVWKENGSKARIDIENPSPGKRPGQIHYQDQNNIKYYYNPKDDKFYVGKISDGKVAPKNIQELLSNPDFRRGIDKGLNYLGEKK